MDEGTLYIVAGPIGNMEDMTFRAVDILKNRVDYIYCEDTRQTRKIINHYGIEAKLKSLHAHSSDTRIEEALGNIKNGLSIAYMTDSGTPGISDPGSRLVRFARDKEIKIIPIPGPSALSAILSVSGFSEKRVIFAGFLSKKEGKIVRELENLRNFQGIIVIYESPYRIKKMLRIIHDIFPEKEIIIGREMTKIYEEFYSGRINGIYENIDDIMEKGEFTLAILNGQEK